MEKVNQINPVGKVIESEKIDEFVESMKGLWDATHEDPKWYQLWKKVNLVPATIFIMNCLDDLIAYADEFKSASGADKKATVLFATTKIYDYIVDKLLPMPVRPFAKSIKGYILGVLISASIDWIVSKYREGEWAKKDKEFLNTHWTKLHVQMFGVPLGGHRPKF